MDKPGLYHGRFLEGKTTEASTGTPQLMLKFEVTHIAVTDAEGNSAWQELEEPMDRTVFLALTDAAWPYAKKKLERNNFNGNFDQPELVVPDGVELVCAEDSYQGRTRSRWDLPLGDGPEMKPAGQDKVRRLNALWQHEHGKPAAPKAPAKPAARPKSKSNLVAELTVALNKLAAEKPANAGEVFAKFQAEYSSGKSGLSLESQADLETKFAEVSADLDIPF